MRGWVKEVKGLIRTKWQLQNSHGDIKYGMGTTAHSIAITVWCRVGTGRTSGVHFVKSMVV